jgi:hypothetical protein
MKKMYLYNLISRISIFEIYLKIKKNLIGLGIVQIE